MEKTVWPRYFFIQKFQAPSASRIGDTALLTSVILAGTVFPRLMLLGRTPVSDEGYYTYVAQQIYRSLANGEGIPDVGGLSFYPMLCSWVFSLQYNPLVTLRLIDLGMAVIMAFLWYKVLARISNNNTGAALITLVFTFTLNQIGFIDSGFKNSIVAAFVPLLLALYVGLGAIQNKESSSAWWVAGALTAIAVVLRETFVPFAALGLVSVFIAQGKGAAFRFFMGGVATGILLIGGILVARGGMAEIIAVYRMTGILVGSASIDSRLENFVFYGLAAIRFSSIVVILSALSVMALLGILRRDRCLAMVFWFSFIGVALFEPITKMCYPYHFTLAFPGLSGLCALALREVIQIRPAMKFGRMTRIIVLTCIALSATGFYFSSSRWAMTHWYMTLETLLAAPGGEWPEKFVNRSEYLFIAAEIKKVIPENGTLSISKNMHALYPLTGYFPPKYPLNDLSAAANLLRFSVPAIRRELLGCAPDVLVVTTMNDDPLLEAVRATGIYETATKIPFDRRGVDSRRNAPFDGLIIFRKTQETDCLEKKEGMADWLTRISA
ncbi:MAG: hypothetical protein LBF93_05375 [Zoogloeaceae bacterium]|jgi:hypothetical protein|nr:hypothetical protein [Zoogloeaceae bacterium]